MAVPPLTSLNDQWAVILGASSGFGGATARSLAKAGMNIFGIHLDMKATKHMAEEVKADIEKQGRKAVFINMNAADEENRKAAVGTLKETLAGSNQKVRVLLHSLAFGTLRYFVSKKPENEPMTQAQLEMTMNVMAHSLVYWVQDVVSTGLFAENGRVLAMTSSGSERAWPTYGAVSAAKCALEAYIRQFAQELAPFNITSNAIRAGITPTPALKKIPGHEQMMEWAKIKNPYDRLTTPEDVATAIAKLSEPETYWMNGNVINVDGGEIVIL
jgi:NAD(P)-dependent dehydrogenase (short-subunit alcohol dehydrogenase family)